MMKWIKEERKREREVRGEERREREKGRKMRRLVLTQ